MAQLVRDLLTKHEVQSLDSQNPYKMPGVAATQNVTVWNWKADRSSEFTFIFHGAEGGRAGKWG